MLELCVLLTGYPLWAGEAAIEFAKDRFTFPPARAELRKLLEDQVVIARQYAWGSEYHRKMVEYERQRQIGNGPPRSERPTLAEMKAKYGDNWGIGPPKETPVETNARWAKQVQTWDEIKAFYEANPERWQALIKPREDGLR